MMIHDLYLFAILWKGILWGLGFGVMIDAYEGEIERGDMEGDITSCR
jgi:hypothetical protein